ncbi:hypothetical protein L0F63_003635, partial [Massospora cicadina]
MLQQMLGVEIREITIEQVHVLYLKRKLTVRKLVDCYLERIRYLNPTLKAVLEVNPDAPLIADKMNTTAGSYSLIDAIPKEDAEVVKRLRKAGAVILGKTNLSEFAGGVEFAATTSGSSSGSAVAVAANLCMVALGTETDGSIISPSSYGANVGLKPTVDDVSLRGVIPFAPSQDSLGPMARTVIDCFKVYRVIALSTQHNLNDLIAPFESNQYLKSIFNSEKPMRLGVANGTYFKNFPRQLPTLDAAIRRLEKVNVELEYGLELKTNESIINSEITKVRHEFKKAIAKYLAEDVNFRRGAKFIPRTLNDIIKFNLQHQEYDPLGYGQDLLVEAVEADNTGFLNCKRSAQLKIQSVIRDHRLDAIIIPSVEPSATPNPAALAGYPIIAIPAGYSNYGVPFGLSIFSLSWDEEKLFNLAYRIEQA